MGKKHNKLRKDDRRARRRAYADVKSATREAARQAWVAANPDKANRPHKGPVTIVFGKHPKAKMTLTFSGVQVPFDLTDPEPNAGLVELTQLALAGDVPEAEKD